MYNTQTTHLKFNVRGFKLPAQKQNYIVVWKDQYFISGLEAVAKFFFEILGASKRLNVGNFGCWYWLHGCIQN